MNVRALSVQVSNVEMSEAGAGGGGARERRITMSQVAAAAGVSKNCVSLALRNEPRIPEATRARILGVAERLGYVKNPVVAHLMTELRRAKVATYRRTFAVVNAHANAKALHVHPTVSMWMDGCRARAAELGYRFDEFWLQDPQLNGERLVRILEARGINGVIVLGHYGQQRLPERFAELWRRQACVVAGVRTESPTLSFCCVDHHEALREAFRHLQGLGYRRPGLVLHDRIDDLLSGRYSGAMWTAQRALPVADRVNAFMKSPQDPNYAAMLGRWLQEESPDVILTLHPEIRPALAGLGLQAPKDIGLVHLELSAAVEGWAGIDQHNHQGGCAAVDMLVNMVHANEKGVPLVPRAMMIAGSWRDGNTVRLQSASPRARRSPAAVPFVST